MAVVGHGPRAGSPVTATQNEIRLLCQETFAREARVKEYELLGSFASGNADRYSDLRFRVVLDDHVQPQAAFLDWANRLPVHCFVIGANGATFVMQGPVLVHIDVSVGMTISDPTAQLAVHLMEAVRDLKRGRYWLGQERLAVCRRLLFSAIARHRSKQVDSEDPMQDLARIEQLLSDEEKKTFRHLAAAYNMKSLAYAFWLVLHRAASLQPFFEFGGPLFEDLTQYYRREFGWLILGPLVAFPMVVSVFLFNRRREVLLLRKAVGTKPWCLPGGGVGQSEEPDRSLVREVFEETGIRLEKFELITLHRGRNPEIMVASYLSKLDDDVEIILSEEHDGYRWCGESDWKEMVQSGLTVQFDPEDWAVAIDSLDPW